MSGVRDVFIGEGIRLSACGTLCTKLIAALMSASDLKQTWSLRPQLRKLTARRKGNFGGAARPRRWWFTTNQPRKGYTMWALVIFTISTTGASASTVTSIQFATQHLCLIAERQLESLTEPIVSEGLVRYAVIGTCVQVSEEPKKK
jgi:hypothetical protein